MTPNEQNRFVKELSQAVVKELQADIMAGRVPEHWAGLELRQLLADRFERAVFKGLLEGSRKRAYRQACLVNNL